MSTDLRTSGAAAVEAFRPDAAVFSVRGLTFAYDDAPPLFEGLDLDIREGAITTFIGANGCGKSTLLNLITKNLVPQAGSIHLRGADVADLRLLDYAKLVAMVHQNNTAPFDMTVEKLVRLGRFPYHHTRTADRAALRDEDERAVAWAIERTGLNGLEKRTIASLSGGQRQRAWIAMALAQGTDVLILDEPTTYLDIRFQLEVLDLVRSLNRDLGMTIVMVLHEVNQALYYSDQIVAFSEGRIAAQGAPAQIVDSGLLRRVYGIDLDVMEIDGKPFVLTVSEGNGNAAAQAVPSARGMEEEMQQKPAEAAAVAAAPDDGCMHGESQGPGASAQPAAGERNPAKQGRSRLSRGLWAGAGAVSFALGAVGTVLPIIPTTPFILLAAFCFARSSDKLNNWFKSTRLYRKVLEGFVTKRMMTVKAKLSIIVPVTILMGIGFALMGRVPVGRIVLAIVWAAHLVYFGFIVKTDKGDADAADGAAAADGAQSVQPERKKKGGGMPMIKTRLLDLLKGAKKYIYLQVLWKWVALASQIVIVYAAARLVQRAYDGVLAAGDIPITLAVVAIGVIVRIVCDRNESRTAYLASVDVKRILRDRIYRKLLRLGASYRDSVATSKVVQLAVEGVEQLETYFSLFISQFFYAFLAPLTLFVVLGVTVNWPTAAVLLVFVPLIPGSIMMVQKIAKKLLSKYWGQYTQLGDTFLENLQGLTTLKIYQADDAATELMDDDSEKFRIATMNVLKMQLNSTTIMDIGAYGGAAVGMVVALSQFFAGNMQLGGLLCVLLLAAEFFLPMRRLGSYFHVGMNGMAASDNIFELLDLPEPDERAAAQLEAGPVSFELVHVDFSYDESRQILDDVSMQFPPGSFTAIVGASGCGKSTVASLMMGKNREFEGSVRVNGIEMGELSESSLLEHVTLVTHASHLFKGTVRENLAMGNPEADDAAMEQVLSQVSMLDFVRERGGLDAAVAEGGGNLSGGQRQRLALARAMLHNTEAYIFDEATSAVDAESEEVIMARVHELAQTRAVVLISHRLANVVAADRIYMMEAGRVVEEGTHAELMAAGGAYAHLFNKQMELESYVKGPDARVQVASASALLDGEGDVR